MYRTLLQKKKRITKRHYSGCYKCPSQKTSLHWDFIANSMRAALTRFLKSLQIGIPQNIVATKYFAFGGTRLIFLFHWEQKQKLWPLTATEGPVQCFQHSDKVYALSAKCAMTKKYHVYKNGLGPTSQLAPRTGASSKDTVSVGASAK